MTTATAARTQRQRWVQAPLDAAFAVLDGWVDYTTSAINHGRLTPLGFAEDAALWWDAATVRTEPQWSTKHKVVRTWPQARLLDFSVAKPTATVPTLLLPPQAGHASTIVDYSAAQSQVGTAMNAGLDKIFVVSWNPATQETSSSSIDEFVAILDDAVETIGGPVNLVGDCQGGWLAVIYAALRPQNVATLTAAGAPIDFHGGQSAIQEWVRQFSRDGELKMYQTLVDLGNGNHAGANQILGFKMLEPPEAIARAAGLWGNIHDPAFVQRHIDFENWFEWGQDLPGAFYLWIVEHLFINNELIKGELVVDGTTVDLKQIKCPVYMLAGTTDHITPPVQMFALADYISTPKRAVTRELVEAGHLGLFMGRAALAGAWTKVFTKIAASQSGGGQQKPAQIAK